MQGERGEAWTGGKGMWRGAGWGGKRGGDCVEKDAQREMRGGYGGTNDVTECAECMYVCACMHLCVCVCV